MKLFLVVCCVVCAQGAVVKNPEEELRQTLVCLQQSGVSDEATRGISTGNFENDPKLKEYLWCISRNAGYLDAAGYLQSDVIRLRLKGGRYNDDTIEEVMQLCTQQKETPQETAFQFMKCVYGNAVQKKYT